MPRPFLLCLIALLVELGACTPAAQTVAPTAAPTVGPAKKIAIAYSNLIADSLSLWVARESGIFAKNGLDVDLQYIASSNAFAALLASQVQASAGGGSEVISGTANGADMVVIANLMPIYPYFNVQGGLAQVPDTLKLEASGLHPVIDMSTLNAPASGTVVTMQRGFIADNKDVAQKLVDSILQAYALEKQDKATTIQVLKQYLKSEDDAAMGATYDYFVAKAPPVLPKPEQFQDSFGVLSEQNPKIKDVDLTKMIDASFFQNALDRKIGSTP